MKYKAAIFCASYNKPDHVMDMVNSVLNQKCDFPYLLWIYDNSTDGKTRDILKKIKSDKVVIHLVDHQDGVNHYFEGLNKFIDSVDAECLFNMQDDDIIESNYLKLMVQTMNQGCDAVYCGMTYIRRNGSVEYYHADVPYPNYEKPIAGNVEIFMIAAKKKVFEKIGYPYIDECPMKIDRIVASVHGFVDRIAQTTTVFPVSEILYIHRNFPNATWTTY